MRIVLPSVAQFGSCLTHLKENVEEIVATVRRAEELLEKLTDQVAVLNNGLSTTKDMTSNIPHEKGILKRTREDEDDEDHSVGFRQCKR
jgi:peptidoglycan hydrolase CwlO-like protein